MKQTPLDFIKDKCVFPITAGGFLGTKKVGPYLLEDQIKIIEKIINEDWSINKNEVCLVGARKNSKTLLISMVLFAIMSNHKKYTGALFPVISSSFNQAKTFYGQVLNFIQAQTDSNIYKIRKEYFVNRFSGSEIRVLYNTEGSALSIEPSGYVVEELGNMKNDNVIQVLNTSLGMQVGKEPLRLYTSNPAESPHHFSVDMLKEVEKRDRSYVHRFTADHRLSIDDCKAWSQANIFVKAYLEGNKLYENVYRFYESEASKALKNKDNEVYFRRYLLGQSLSVETTKWINGASLRVAKKDVFNNKDLQWCIGFDGSISRDATAISITGTNYDRSVCYSLPLIFYPNINNFNEIKRKRIQKYAAQGYCYIQNKPVIDKAHVVKVLKEVIKRNKLDNKIDKAVLDPYATSFYGPEMESLGIEVQYKKFMPLNTTNSIRYLERLADERKLYLIGENKCAREHISSTLNESRHKGYCQINRSSHRHNIDYSAALVLAGIYLFDSENQPVDMSQIIGGFGYNK